MQTEPATGAASISDADQPRFSVVITSHNQREFIRDAVESALAQACRSKEIIVVDDGSTDGSREVLQPFANLLTLALLPQNVGALRARNHGAELARGRFIAFLDGDDALRPWALDVYDRLISARTPKLILGAKTWCRDMVTAPTAPRLPQAIEFVQYETLFAKDRPADMGASTFVIDRTTFWNAGGWSPGIFHLDNYDICTKVGVAGRTILVKEPRTALYRIHATNSIHAVKPFVAMAHHLLDREADGVYPGGRKHRFQRHAWLGGMIFFWSKRALKAGLYRDGARLALRGSSMILAGVVRRCIVRLRGKRPFERVSFVA